MQNHRASSISVNVDWLRVQPLALSPILTSPRECQAWTFPTLTLDSLISYPCWWFLHCFHHLYHYKTKRWGLFLTCSFFLFSLYCRFITSVSDKCSTFTPFLNGDTQRLLSLCLSYRDAEAFTEQHKLGIMSTTSSNVSISTTRPPLAPTPAVPPVNFAQFDPAPFREVSPKKPQTGSGNLGESLLYIIIYSRVSLY